ncbi:potassium transporter TrkA [Marinicella pacifica]|uniref:Potassium transporter TrkA n=1 Tax=Marinicella pacifica TaxID=1171543 RepID=A0A917CJ90_9GAMM|nr:cation:proton antiporter [Marinicella pacifica]GGF90426.1 potassium transporter TrkA [Marinicella pacifica]
MPETGSSDLLFWNALALIVAASVFVPVFVKIKFGAVLGYLVAGIAVNLLFSGGFSEHPEELLHFSEFGVVLFLFVIGLELNPATLWDMRKDIFGLGAAQVLFSALVIGLLAYFVGIHWTGSVVIGSGMALSSTAIVMSQLSEKGERRSLHGRKTFGILLFQDIAIVPLLLLVTLLAPTGEDVTLVQSLIDIGFAVVAIVALILIGYYVLDHVFRLLASTGLHEIMTASALGLVIAAALLMDVVGMSNAMGAFLAGVMLSESSYRHEVKANIEPFRGLFLGLFFMAVGLALDLRVVMDNWLLILAIAPGVMLLKTILLYVVSRFFKHDHNTSIRLAFALPQLGEFGFVLFSAAATAGIFADNVSSILIAIVSVTMMMSPLPLLFQNIFINKELQDVLDETFEDTRGNVLIIGFGRFGQMVSQPLFADGYDVTILDNDARRIREARGFGFKVNFGDGTRRDILRAAGAESCEVVIFCTNNPEVTNRSIRALQAINPQAKVFVRSYNRRHSIDLHDMNVTFSIRETFESALILGKQVLIELGVSEEQASDYIEDIRIRDLERLQEQAEGDMESGMERVLRKPVKSD